MWFVLPAFWLGIAPAQDTLSELPPATSADICVRAYRDSRQVKDAPELAQGFAVPPSVAQVRNRVGVGRLPNVEVDSADFLNWMPEDLPEQSVKLVTHVETARHPLHPKRFLLRVSYRAPEAPGPEDPVFLVALVNASSSMRSVGTRTLPVMVDQVSPDEATGLYRPVTRMELIRDSLQDLSGKLPKGSMVAVAAFDRGAKVVLPPTMVSSQRMIQDTLEDLQTEEIRSGQGIDVVAQLVEQIRSYCGDTHVVVISDGPLGFGAPEDETLELVQRLSSEGVTFSVLLPMTRMRRAPALEQLAWLGHGRHHYAESMADVSRVWETEFSRDGWTARDVELRLEPPSQAGVTVRRLGGEGLVWSHDGLTHLDGGEALFEVQFTSEQPPPDLGQFHVSAKSAIPGDWELSETMSIPTPKQGLKEASVGLRRAWVATSLAEFIGGEDSISLSLLQEMARSSLGERPNSDLELLGLIERFRKLIDEAP